MPDKAVTTYKEFKSHFGRKSLIRNLLRDGVIASLSLLRSVQKNCDSIRFPYYHHVFDDERHGFEEHLKYFKNMGDFIAIDEAIALIESGNTIKGKYFCITFDDGYKSCVTNALPILNQYGAAADFFIPTKYIGLSVKDDIELCSTFYKGYRILLEFLTWNDCRTLISNGMTIGSHTVNHNSLMGLSSAEAENELVASKKEIERRLEVSCRHFCAPNGIPNVHFMVDRDPDLAKKAGYKSFLTTRRGATAIKMNPMLIMRDHFIAAWKTNQLRYFYSK
jgi:peptidoglycan/xylan/chitin deacetylase (PgdA/CDA1 family)